MSLYDDEATEKAIKHHWRWCERNGLIPNQPSSTDSERVGNTVYLRNCRGLMVRYRVSPDGRVRRLNDRVGLAAP
jgi:hypothetical protein